GSDLDNALVVILPGGHRADSRISARLKLPLRGQHIPKNGGERWRYASSSSNGIFLRSAHSSANSCEGRRQNRTRTYINSFLTLNGTRSTPPKKNLFASISPKTRPSSANTPRSAAFRRPRSLK